jgi:hypothetical protein
MATKTVYITIQATVEVNDALNETQMAEKIAEECDYKVEHHDDLVQIVRTELLDVTTEIPECGYYAG